MRRLWWVVLLCALPCVAQEPSSPVDNKAAWHDIGNTPVRVCWKIGQAKECTPPGDREFLQTSLDNYRSAMPGDEAHFWMEPANLHFWQRHPNRTIALIMAGGGAIGLTVGLLTRHTCPKVINGYAYDGTPPCPGKNYDPGGGLRWRF